jgi:beta-galactosidase
MTGINAQPQKFKTVLYGVAYYQEYMPYERLEKDVQMMQDAGNFCCSSWRIDLESV